MLTRLNPTIPLDTPRGKADAWAVIDYSENHPLLFAVFLRNSGECWVIDQRQVKLERNLSLGIRVGEGS